MKYVVPYRWIFLLSLLGAVVDAAMQATFIAMLSPILDEGFSNQNSLWIKFIPFFIVGIFLIRSIGNFIAAYGFTWLGRKIVNDLRRQVFSQYLKLPQKFYDQNSSGSLISRMTYDIEQMANGVSKNVIFMIREILTIFFLLIVMFYYSWQLALVAFAVFPVVLLAISLINKRFRKIGHSIQSSIANITQIVEEVVKGQKIVKIFKGEKEESEKFSKNIKNNRQLQVKIVATQEFMSAGILMLAACALAVIMYLAAKSGMSGYDFMSFMTAMLALMPTVKKLSGVFATIQTTLAAADSVMMILEQEPESDTGDVTLEAKEVTVQFENVSFSYDDDSQALSDISFVVPAGQSVAFVGPSGGGKTSLVNLLPRFYEYTTGKITINGEDIRSFSLDSLREHIAVVSQEVVLFNDTVTNNIAYGVNASKSPGQIMDAAKKANALDFINQLPDGFDTLLGDNGTRLSGGQRQRIAIARAILKDAPLLILDEATSALDTESEKHIQLALEEVMKNKTTLVIAHRLSTIEHADRVVVLDQGKIVQQGSHQQLVQQEGVYAQLQKSQQVLPKLS
ncbi:MAG: lipid A export permease/ATP-binding protein MsbA [Proteobacteria bacterium]|nr:lipid A export permease/ATP-binding protein MsbA [Pseudomonadota bacterium]